MHGRPRCREWTPLVTQQLRLRNLIQITGHNLVNDNQCSFYYTLHLTSMCAPFYTSEKIDNNNPAWCDIDCELLTKSSSKSVFIRIWKHYPAENKDIIFLKWGIFFSGLVNIENRNSMNLVENSLVFQLNGGFFTSYDCLLNRNPVKIFISSKKEAGEDNTEPIDVYKVRYTSLKFLNSEIRPSYNVQKLLQLQDLQLLFKKRLMSAYELREKICLKSPICLENCTDNKAKLIEHRKKIYKELNSNRLNWYMLQQSPQPDPDKILRAHELHKQIETAKCVCKLLNVEADLKRIKLRLLQSQKLAINESNNDLGSDLMNNYHSLSKDRENSKKNEFSLKTLNDSLNVTKAALCIRQAKLLSGILTIYPITEVSKDIMNILNVPLPDAESLNQNYCNSLSVALGFAAHTVYMISIILQIPLRYPLIHLGSRSKIIDNVTDYIADNEREFPLHSKSNYSTSALHYGVYLLNKNIAQLRWSLLGLVTKDLRATLPNLKGFLLNLSLRENSLGIAKTIAPSESPMPTQNEFLNNYNDMHAKKLIRGISRSIGSSTESRSVKDYMSMGKGKGNCTSEPSLHSKSVEISHNTNNKECNLGQNNNAK